MLTRSLLLSLVAGVALAGGLLSSPMAEAQSVPAAENAAQVLLPQGSRIVGSMLISPNRAQIQVERAGQVNWVVMDLAPNGQWQQNLQATMELAATELQAQASLDPLPGFGQTATDEDSRPGSLLDSTRQAINLLPAADPEQETQRALSVSGRADPFAPVDAPALSAIELPPLDPGAFPPLPPTPFPLPPLGVPPVPGSNLQPPVPTPLPPPATPTPDPAQFARSVQVTGLIQIDNESFALVTAPDSSSTVVQTGSRFESAEVSSTSVVNREVILQEGGETVIKSVDE
ncbi:MAG: hypothetical protein HC924_07855 [Synechococcaceae cyanobacterium SM2_3_2]|nr:hypothetical protein [Synechococcaceae cyanobacterium SM2_3_2]